MSFELDFLDYAIFFELHSDSFISANQIALNLEVSPSTVIDRIRRMKQMGFLKGTDEDFYDPLLGKREQTEVLAEYNPKSLNLIRQHVFFENVHSKKTLARIEKFADEHPYTHYRAKLFSNSATYYLQFDVPISIQDDMIDVYKEIQKKLSIKNLSVINSNVTAHTKPNLSNAMNYIDEREEVIKEVESEINSKNESTMFHAYWHIFDVGKDSLIPSSDDTDKPLNQFSNLDAQLLRELTINGKVPVKFLAEEYNRDKSIISRHLKKLKEKVISRGILRYDHQAFGLNYLQIIKGKFVSGSDFNGKSFKNYLETFAFPFESSLTIDNQHFVFYSTASPRVTTDITSFIWEYSDPKSFQVYQLDLKSSYGYYFYPANYDEKEGWNTRKEYYNDDPLNIIQST